MVGSGAWASAAVRMIAQNTRDADPADEFVDDVTMWVYEEDYEVGIAQLAPLIIACVLMSTVCVVTLITCTTLATRRAVHMRACQCFVLHACCLT